CRTTEPEGPRPKAQGPTPKARPPSQVLENLDLRLRGTDGAVQPLAPELLFDLAADGVREDRAAHFVDAEEAELPVVGERADDGVRLRPEDGGGLSPAQRAPPDLAQEAGAAPARRRGIAPDQAREVRALLPEL